MLSTLYHSILDSQLKLFSMGGDPFPRLPVPAELVCRILGCLESPKDLLSVLRASPYIYSTFTTSKEYILRQVARNGFKSTALAAAITAVRFPPTEYFQPTTPQDHDHALHRHTESLSLLTKLLEREKVGEQGGPTLDESVGLCSLLSSFEVFVRDCSNQFLATAGWELARKSEPGVPRNLSPGLLEEPISLSPTEVGRLQGAFIRYTTLQSLVYITPHSPRSGEGLNPQDIASLFVYFTPWEVEEIACIHQYYLGWLRRILDEVEDEFVESVVTAEGSSRLRFLGKEMVSLDDSDSEDPFVCNEECELGPDGVTWQLTDSTDVGYTSTVMFLKSQKELQPALIENLATLPLRWFRTLVQSSNPQRRDMINHDFEERYNSIGRALCIEILPQDRRHFQAERQSRESGQRLNFNGDDLERRNFAWLWYHQMRPYPDYNTKRDADLRAWGYVFWDKDRLEQMRLLECEKPCPLRYRDAFPAGYEVKTRPSGQERLRNLGLA